MSSSCGSSAIETLFQIPPNTRGTLLASPSVLPVAIAYFFLAAFFAGFFAGAFLAAFLTAMVSILPFSM